MYRIRKSFTFESAHQLEDAFTKLCSDTIHGHSYTVEVFLCLDTLDKDGMVTDFGRIKHLFKDIIDGEYDHSLIMPNTTPEDYMEVLGKYNKRLIVTDFNPTAENLAKQLYFEFLEVIPEEVNAWISKVRVWETATGWAEFTEEG